MAHHFHLGLSMGRVYTQPETDLTTSSGRATDHRQPLKTTRGVGFDAGERRSVLVKTHEEQRS